MEDSNLVELDKYRKIKYLEANIKELEELCPALKAVIKSLTKYDKYSTIRRRVDDLFVLYQDFLRTKNSQKESLERLKHE